MLEILFTVLFLCLFGWAVKLLFKITWGVAKVIGLILAVLALPALIIGLVAAGGFILLIPVALIAGAVGLLKACG
ncbi:MAG: hypothetical protein PUB99_05080 [Oscillospiraceae bacterium]|nr:hypothetical protein [Oscillospiraceae bacterium]